MISPLVEVRELCVTYRSPGGPVRAVRNVSFHLAAGETVALVGETGSGKSTIARTFLGLQQREGHEVSGRLIFEGRDLLRMTEADWRRYRGSRISLLFQDARGSLNPVLTVGAHLVEAIRAHRPVSRREARAEALRLLQGVGVPDPEFYFGRFPAELSTGLCQRVGIALGLCHRPGLLIADEPTSALDPSIQQQIIALLRELKRRHSLTMLLISHDLTLVAGLADRITVLYHGRVAESGKAAEILEAPAHPYSRALLACRPGLEHTHDRLPLPVIPGTPPVAESELPGCPFAPRCGIATAHCTELLPAATVLSDTHLAACHYASGGAK